MEHEPREYRLGSSALVHTPGVIAWAINGAKFERYKAKMIKLVADTWSIPTHAALALVTEKVPYTVEDEAVVFTA